MQNLRQPSSIVRAYHIARPNRFLASNQTQMTIAGIGRSHCQLIFRLSGKERFVFRRLSFGIQIRQLLKLDVSSGVIVWNDSKKGAQNQIRLSDSEPPKPLLAPFTTKR